VEKFNSRRDESVKEEDAGAKTGFVQEIEIEEISLK